MRLIDADALMAEITEENPLVHFGPFGYAACSPDSGLGEKVFMRERVLEIVESAPTVDAVALPCKVGDEVWCLRDTRVYNKPVKGVVSEIYFRDNMDMCIVVRRLCRGRWGERVFATEQEAKAAIDRQREANG